MPPRAAHPRAARHRVPRSSCCVESDDALVSCGAPTLAPPCRLPPAADPRRAHQRRVHTSTGLDIDHRRHPRLRDHGYPLTGRTCHRQVVAGVLAADPAPRVCWHSSRSTWARRASRSCGAVCASSGREPRVRPMSGDEHLVRRKRALDRQTLAGGPAPAMPARQPGTRESKRSAHQPTSTVQTQIRTLTAHLLRRPPRANAARLGRPYRNRGLDLARRLASPGAREQHAPEMITAHLADWPGESTGP